VSNSSSCNLYVRVLEILQLSAVVAEYKYSWFQTIEGISMKNIVMGLIAIAVVVSTASDSDAQIFGRCRAKQQARTTSCAPAPSTCNATYQTRDVCTDVSVCIGGVKCSAKSCCGFGGCYLKDVNCGTAPCFASEATCVSTNHTHSPCEYQNASTLGCYPWEKHCHTRGSCDRDCLERSFPACLAICSVDPTGAACAVCLGGSWGVCCSKYVECHCNH